MSKTTFEQQVKAAVRGLIEERVGGPIGEPASLGEILAAFANITPPPLCGEGRITNILLDGEV